MRAMHGLLASLVLPLMLLFPSGGMADPALEVDICRADPEPPAYYRIQLVSTGRIPGTRLLEGAADVTFARSPFGISVGPTGTYVYDLSVAVPGLRPARDGAYVVWVTTRNLDQVKRLGELDDEGRIQGQVDWNKFLVVVSLESDANRNGEAWQGPIVVRGMSRSGLMHTMAGHGPFDQEPCAVYGY